MALPAWFPVVHGIVDSHLYLSDEERWLSGLPGDRDVGILHAPEQPWLFPSHLRRLFFRLHWFRAAKEPRASQWQLHNSRFLFLAMSFLRPQAASPRRAIRYSREVSVKRWWPFLGEPHPRQLQAESRVDDAGGLIAFPTSQPKWRISKGSEIMKRFLCPGSVGSLPKKRKFAAHQ